MKDKHRQDSYFKSCKCIVNIARSLFKLNVCNCLISICSSHEILFFLCVHCCEDWKGRSNIFCFSSLGQLSVVGPKKKKEERQRITQIWPSCHPITPSANCPEIRQMEAQLQPNRTGPGGPPTKQPALLWPEAGFFPLTTSPPPRRGSVGASITHIHQRGPEWLVSNQEC